MIIPQDERSWEPLEGEGVLTHPDMRRAWKWIFEEYEPPKRELVIFIPCSVQKPYSQSPSHKLFRRIIFSLVPEERVHIVVFGTCGIVPGEFESEYPFAHYKFMMGKARKEVKEQFIIQEKEILAKYLEKTRDKYTHRIAYCLGDFRKAMELAVEKTGIEMQIFPLEETLLDNFQGDKDFHFGSLFQKGYLNDLAQGIAKVMGLAEPKLGIIKGVSEDESDFYVL